MTEQEYTPTTDEVEETFIRARPLSEVHSRRAGFRAWLAEHDRQVAERVWNACAQETGRLIDRQPAALMADILTASNPYRKAAND